MMNKVPEPVEGTPLKHFANAKRTVPKPARHGTQQPSGITYSHEVYYENDKEDGLQEAASDCKEQSNW